MKKKRKSKKTKLNRKHLMLLVWLFYIVGVLVFIYPFIAQMYHSWTLESVAKNYRETVTNQDAKSLEQIKKELEEHNAQLEEDQAKLTPDNFSVEAEKRLEEQGISFAHKEKLGDVIAVLEIPKIKLELPVYYGTNNEQISNGVGVMKETSMPFGGENTHSVMTSHRGLPTAKLFTDLPQLEEGDSFFINVADETLAYKVDQIKVIDPDDFSELQIIPGGDYVTLLTCTPYMVNTHRILVRGERVTPFKPEMKIKEKAKAKSNFWRNLAIFLAVLIGVGLGVYAYKKRKEKNTKASKKRHHNTKGNKKQSNRSNVKKVKESTKRTPSSKKESHQKSSKRKRK
ncbi:MAG: class C sortase [Vagococcus sp.]|uniref:class C sortase n=1 Tax=Vagococcus TaxID=2737 RepID=UPI002FC72297